MGAVHVLPPPLDIACHHGHPLELWVLVNGEIVQCSGTFMRTDDGGRPQVTATLPEDFVGIVRNGAAVRGFFTNDGGQVHTFLTSIHDWRSYRDRPSAAKVVLESPSAVAPCQRRRGLRQPTKPIYVSLMVTIRGKSEGVEGRLVDVSPTGFAVRVVRAARNWYAEGTLLEVEVKLASQPEPATLAVTVSRVQRESLHYLYGLRVNNAAERRALQDILDELLLV
jgi:hypothetical protein